MTVTVVYADTSDGFIFSVDDTYADCLRSGGGDFGFGALTAEGVIDIGQLQSGGAYDVYEGFLIFDTSAVGTDAVSVATLELYGVADSSDTDFTINAYGLTWTAALSTSDWQTDSDLGGLTTHATFATSGFSTSGYNTFTSNASLLTHINGSGDTSFCLASQETEDASAPSGLEDVVVYAADEAGTTKDPKLTITHAAGSGGIEVLRRRIEG